MKAGEVWLEGKRVRLDPRHAIGKGGEADVYDLGDGRALKIYKAPEHADFAGDAAAQDGARLRLNEVQTKLPAFPRGLPARVVAPSTPATVDPRGQRIAGYAMPLVAGAEPMLEFGDGARSNGAGLNRIVDAFRDLHALVSGVHRAGIIIGDFNDLNVLVRPTTGPQKSAAGASCEAWLIDADSFSFGAFTCRVFTARFVDPCLCDPQAPQLTLYLPHTAGSDWYAYEAMLMRALLGVEPFGGLYRPQDKANNVAHHLRPLHRITVFHPEVRYPKPARPLLSLPDELLDHLQKTFAGDQRREFPRPFLENLRWTTCTTCNREHARAHCPFCLAQPAPAAVLQTITIRGRVTATRLLRTEGVLLSAALQNGQLRWLLHENGTFKREDGSIVGQGTIEPGLLLRLHGDATLIGRGGDVGVLRPNATPQRLSVDTCGGQPVVAANGEHIIWAQNGQLWRDSRFGLEYPEAIGDVLSHQTRFWLGPTFGFGFYRAGELCVSFVFDAHQGGLNDEVKLKLGSGQLVSAACAFAPELCWFFAALQEGGQLVHRCFVIRRDGTIAATGAAMAGDGSWLGVPNAGAGACAAGEFLLAPTDDGMVRVDAANGALTVTKTFPDTEPWVRADSRLHPGPDGIYVVARRDIYLLKMT